MNDPEPRTMLITGVSSGIGHGLATFYLEQGWRVLGTSRRTPADLLEHSRFLFRGIDLGDPTAIAPPINALLGDTRHLDLVVLNAGVLGGFGDLGDADLDDLTRTMQVNVWSNKCLLDALYGTGVTIQQVVAISSGASVNGNRGWGGYSISKAALNMLVTLYARERPETHFAALAPGLVDTFMQEQLRARTPDERYPAVEVLRNKQHTPDMPRPDAAAEILAATMAQLPERVSSGAYADIRTLTAEA
jgi:NAD(P)-dependent dehydrogenase (short-subunit alcohol dehydrogenase family)